MFINKFFGEDSFLFLHKTSANLKFKPKIVLVNYVVYQLLRKVEICKKVRVSLSGVYLSH